MLKRVLLSRTGPSGDINKTVCSPYLPLQHLMRQRVESLLQVSLKPSQNRFIICAGPNACDHQMLKDVKLYPTCGEIIVKLPFMFL